MERRKEIKPNSMSGSVQMSVLPLPWERDGLKCLVTVLMLIVLSNSNTFAQQIPLFSLYHENGFILNPAITGAEGLGIAALSYRHQWTEVNEAPNTISGGYRMPIYSKGDQFQKAGNFIGVGAYVMNDQTGPTSYLSGNISFAYHISFAKINPFHWAAFLRKSHLSIGINASVNQYRLNATELLPETANDRLVIAADDSKILPNAGLGFYYYYDKFYFGFSTPQVIPLKVKYVEYDGASTIHKINHYYIVAGGKIPFGGKVTKSKTPRGYTYKFYLEPMVWFKTVQGAPYQYEAYMRFRHKNMVWVGAGYRSSKTIVIDAGVLIKKQLKLGYAYDLTVSDLSSYLGGSHEVVLAYQIDFASRYRR